GEEDKSSSSPFAYAQEPEGELGEEDKSSSSPFAYAQEPEGELAIDVYQTEDDLVIQSAIAGVKPNTLDVSMEKDIVIIRGMRKKPFEEKGDYFSQECYWGAFSREIILPSEVNPNQSKAEMKDGILTIRIPKMLREKKRRIVIEG
ncbi:MAG: Hsp20/alpha crystallin family protein, partial [bacterium]